MYTHNACIIPLSAGAVDRERERAAAASATVH